MKSSPTFAILGLLLLLLTACIGQADTQELKTPGVDTPLAETLPPGTATSIATATLTAAPTSTSTATIEPTPTSTTTPQSLQLSQWHSIKFFDLRNGWAVDREGAVFRMTAERDGWQEVTPPGAVISSQLLTSFLDAQNAWLIYHGDPAPPAGPWQIWNTRDGGQSWESVGELGSAQERQQLIEMSFLDANYGWVLGQIYPGMHRVFAVLYTTSDGGETWQVVSSPAPPVGPEQMNLPGSYSLPFGSQTVTFVSPQIGFTGGDNLYRTQDGGQTWQPQPISQPPDLPSLEQPFVFIGPPRFSDAMSAVFQYLVFDFANVFCPPCDIFAAPPAAVYTYHTQDSGETWTPQPAPGLLGMAGMLDADTAWYLGRERPDQSTTNFYLSHDQGATWQVQAENTILPLGTRLYFNDDGTGFAYNPFVGQGFSIFQDPNLTNLAGEEAYFYFTDDGGATWAPFPPTYP